MAEQVMENIDIQKLDAIYQERRAALELAGFDLADLDKMNPAELFDLYACLTPEEKEAGKKKYNMELIYGK
jgi:hypothetical protein